MSDNINRLVIEFRKELEKAGFDDWLEFVKKQFAYYGFTYCPLTDQQVEDLYWAGFSLEETYNVGCDVGIGRSFTETKQHYLEEM